MAHKNVRPGAIDLDEMLQDIEVPSFDVPDLDVFPSQRSEQSDLFAERKFSSWKETDTAEARCDFATKMKISNRSGVTFITLWAKSVYGRTLTDIKADDSMIDFFADNIAPLVVAVLGSHLDCGDWAVVTTPKRRHRERNFATLVAARLADVLGLPFFEDCAEAPSRHRVGAVFTPLNIPPQRNIIVFDDFVTTGQTLASIKALLGSLGKNTVFFAGIFNHIYKGSENGR